MPFYCRIAGYKYKNCLFRYTDTDVAIITSCLQLTVYLQCPNNINSLRITVAYHPYDSHLNWIIDPAPPPIRDHGNIIAPAPSRDHDVQPSGKENVPPQDVLRKLPRKMRLRRRKGRQPEASTNQNFPAWNAGRKTQPAPTANQNLASREAVREM